MQKALLALAALLILPCVARGQGSLYDNPVLGANGRPIVGAQYQVCTALGVQGSLCTPAITVYSNSTLTSAITSLNQVTDSQGNLTFWLTPGTYYLTLYGAGIRTQTRAISVPCLPGTGCALTGTASALTSATANPASAGVIRLAVGDTACWRNNANTLNKCFSINGADALLFDGAGLVQTGIANTFTANQSFPTIISTTANPSSGGWARLANGDQFCWRNAANAANNCMSMSTDFLLYGGARLANLTDVQSFTGKQTFTGGIAGLAAGETVYSAGNFSTGSTGYTSVTGMSVTVTTRGGKVLVTATYPCSAVLQDGSFILNQDASADTLPAMGYCTAGVNNASVTSQHLFTPAAGAHTYELRALTLVFGGTIASNMASNQGGYITAIEVSQ